MKRWNVRRSIYKLFALGLTLLLGLPCSGQNIVSGPYLGQSPPGLVPEIFAPDIVSLPDRFEYCLSFSPNGNECAFGVTNGQWSWCVLYYMKQQSDGQWTDPDTAYFQNGFDGWLPHFSHDDKFYFSSGRPDLRSVHIYRCDRIEGGWSDPIKLDGPVNVTAFNWRPTTTSDGALYFCSNRDRQPMDMDIYRSDCIDGKYPKVENLGAPVNNTNTNASPFIAPDEKYLLMESWEKDNFGLADLYISYRREDSSWTDPQNLGPTINTDQIDDGGFISPDGRYLFFNRRKGWVTSEQTEIHWVDSRIVFKPYVNRPLGDINVSGGESFHFKIPKDIIKDYDDNVLNFDATQKDGNPLPDWLNFDAATLAFSGVPPKSDSLTLTLIATDQIGSKVSTSFMIIIGSE